MNATEIIGNLVSNRQIHKIKFNLKFIILVIFFILISFDITFNLKLGWDAQKLWFPKVLNFYQGNSFDNLKTLYWPELGLTLDEQGDFLVLEQIIQFFNPKIDFSLKDIIDYLRDNPKILEKNSHVIRKGDT